MIGSAGIIFQQPTHKKKIKREMRHDLGGDSDVGQASEFPSRSRHSRFFVPRKIFSKLGSILIVFSLLGFGFTYGPIIKVELGYRLSQLVPETTEQPRGQFQDLIDKTFLGEIEGVPDPNFSLIIPKIHAKSKIVADVDPSDEVAYMDALKVGVAHAKGTRLPGDAGTIYMFAHSTDNPLNVIRYNAIFYLLREMAVGDEIQVYFHGIKHRYTVTDTKIVEPTDISYLSADNPEGKETLILQTCWPPGTRLKRLLVFAQKSLDKGL